MVGSYCRAEKVGVFTPAPLDKVLKRSVERAEELGPWVGERGGGAQGAAKMSRHGHTAQKNKSNAPCCIPLLLSHCSVCFACFNVLVKTERAPGDRVHPEAKHTHKPLCNRLITATPAELHNLTAEDFLWTPPNPLFFFFDRTSHSHADGMCGFAAIQIDGHSLVCN